VRSPNGNINFRIIGALIQYHELRNHPSSLPNDVLESLVARIRTMLEEYEYSLGLLLPDDPSLPALYAQHIYHTLYVILYGKLDLINMLDDYEWLASEHFVIAGDHAVKAAQVLPGVLLSILTAGHRQNHGIRP
jgi:hypothetical protein